LTSTTFSHRHQPYVINRYSFVRGGANDLYQIDFINDRRQGFGVPAKSVVVRNDGGGVGSDYLHVQYAEYKHYYTPDLSLYEGEALVIKPDDGVLVSNMLIWADSARLSFSLVATPGQWSNKELKDFGLLGTIVEQSTSDFGGLF